MAKVKTKNNSGIHTTTITLWEFQMIGGGWISEDDELSASFKAVKETGRIRFQEQTTVENLDDGSATITKTPWTTFRQKLIK